MSYNVKTALILAAAVAAYLAGAHYSSGPMLLAGLCLEGWALVRAGRNHKPRDQAALGAADAASCGTPARGGATAGPPAHAPEPGSLPRHALRPRVDAGAQRTGMGPVLRGAAAAT